MKISVRILLGYFLIVGLAAWFVLNVFIEEVKPGVRQAMEDTLVDSANLLAELATEDMRSGHIADGAFARALTSASEREVHARVWGLPKNSIDYRVYVTDARGLVVFDSAGTAVGSDYSSWNDVLLTLRGQYGARSTQGDPTDKTSTIMHVAAPIRDQGRIIGVLTLAKPNAAVQPFIDRGRDKIRRSGALLLGSAAAIGMLFTWRLTRSLNRLRRYARDVSEGRRTAPPESGSSEIAELGRALEAMREKLEGRQYVENYVHALTHEMKSPLAAIHGAAELMDEEMPREARVRFLGNIRAQCDRLERIADRMLRLAQVEQQRTPQARDVVDLGTMLGELVQEREPVLRGRGLTVAVDAPDGTQVLGERFLLQQAIGNLVDNAIDFAPTGTTIDIAVVVAERQARITVRDRGPGVPEYARERVFERFYSLPRPDSGQKSTGLGLPFAREVAHLHGGTVELAPHREGGTVATLALPAHA